MSYQYTCDQCKEVIISDVHTCKGCQKRTHSACRDRHKCSSFQSQLTDFALIAALVIFLGLHMILAAVIVSFGLLAKKYKE